jgi:hypothetical protein
MEYDQKQKYFRASEIHGNQGMCWLIVESGTKAAGSIRTK